MLIIISVHGRLHPTLTTVKPCCTFHQAHVDSLIIRGKGSESSDILRVIQAAGHAALLTAGELRRQAKDADFPPR